MCSSRSAAWRARLRLRRRQTLVVTVSAVGRYAREARAAVPDPEASAGTLASSCIRSAPPSPRASGGPSRSSSALSRAAFSATSASSSFR
eukprot:1179373-Prorocentrum_minimum.AAC.8